MKIVAKGLSRAFSLIEMLIVLTVIAVVFAFAAPDLFSLINSSSLSSEGTYLRNALTQAQQTALSKNTDVEVRFFNLADDAAAETEEAYRAYQTFQFNEDGEMVPAGKFTRINAPVALSNRLSTLLIKNPTSADDKKYGYVSPQQGTGYEIPVGISTKKADYMAFRFRPDGSTDLPVRSNGDTWYLTLIQGEGAVDDADPQNYFCLQVNPYNGQITEFRP